MLSFVVGQLLDSVMQRVASSKDTAALRRFFSGHPPPPTSTLFLFGAGEGALKRSYRGCQYFFFEEKTAALRINNGKICSQV